MKVLYIDLAKQDYEEREREDIKEKHLGGVGAAAKLLLEECPKNVDPLSPENVIILAIGPLGGLFPLCTKVAATFKSPLNNEYGESYAGGRLASAMRFSGHDAIVIKGRSEEPVYLSIHDDDIKFEDATLLWGIKDTYAVGRIIRERETGAGRRSIIRIGPAGERGVRYASVIVDSYRHFGRLGLGAVFGSKNLKGMVISGKKEFKAPDMSKFNKTWRNIMHTTVNTDIMEKYHDLGTSANILPLNYLKGLPTKNFTSAQFSHAQYISGETFAEDHLTRKTACIPCPIGCIHIASLRFLYAPQHEYATVNMSYDYELIYALGSLLGITDSTKVLMLIEKCERYGLDAMSTGVCLAWATEMYEKNLISAGETLGIPLAWDHADSYSKAIDNIILQKNHFYQELAKGIDHTSEHWGGEEFGMTLGGLEVSGYHTGASSIVGQIVGARHSHLDNAGYSIDQKAASAQTPLEKQVEAIIKEEYWRCLVNSLIICLFARNIYTEEIVLQTLDSVGIEKTEEDLWNIGRENWKLKWEFKKREGFDLDNVKIPSRFFETTSMTGKLEREVIEEMLRMYKEKVGQ